MIKHVSIILLFLACITHSAAADTGSKIIVVDEILYIVDGSTSEKALAKRSDLKPGMEFSIRLSLEVLAEREKQDLINRRVFESVEYTLTQLSADENTEHYRLEFIIVDAFSITPVPYPKYDTNTGLRFGLKLYWNNFLGTMTNGYLGTGFNIQYNGTNDKWEIGEWNVGVNFSGIYLTDHMALSAGVSQDFIEDDYDDTVDDSNDYDYSFYQTGLGIGTSYEIVDNLRYGFGIASTFRYGYEGNLGPNFEQPWALVPNQSLSYGQVDWEANFRRGFSTGISNSFRMGTNEGFFLITDIDISAQYYYPFWKRFNFYAQARGFYQWGEIRSNYGRGLRGVQDNIMSGFIGATLNMSLGFQFWRFENVWDAQIHPFFDMGIIYNNESFDAFRDFNYSFGADLVLYLDVLPSLVAVGSIGIDPKRFDKNNILGSLEITITSSLFY